MLQLELYGKLKKEDSKIAVGARSIVLVIAKEESGFWPRLTHATGKARNIKIDWNKCALPATAQAAPLHAPDNQPLQRSVQLLMVCEMASEEFRNTEIDQNRRCPSALPVAAVLQYAANSSTGRYLWPLHQQHGCRLSTDNQSIMPASHRRICRLSACAAAQYALGAVCARTQLA